MIKVSQVAKIYVAHNDDLYLVCNTYNEKCPKFQGKHFTIYQKKRKFFLKMHSQFLLFFSSKSRNKENYTA